MSALNNYFLQNEQLRQQLQQQVHPASALSNPVLSPSIGSFSGGISVPLEEQGQSGGAPLALNLVQQQNLQSADSLLSGIHPELASKAVSQALSVSQPPTIGIPSQELGQSPQGLITASSISSSSSTMNGAGQAVSSQEMDMSAYVTLQSWNREQLGELY
jgi:hypothetical protein